MSALSEAELTDIWNRREDQYKHLPDHSMTAGPDGFRGWLLDQLEGFTSSDILKQSPEYKEDRAMLEEAGVATQPDVFKYLNHNLLLSGGADLTEKLALGHKTTAGDYGWAGLDVAGVTGAKPLWKLLDKTVIDPLSNTMKARKANQLDKGIREFDPDFKAQANHLLELHRTLDPEKRVNMGQFSASQINDKRFKQSELRLLNMWGRENWENLFKKDKSIYPPELKRAAERGDAHMIPWYGGPYNKMLHLVDMIHTGFKARGEVKHMLDSVDAFFTPNVLKELDKIGSSHARGTSKGVMGARIPTDKLGSASRDRQANIFNDQIGHILATLEMYYPHHAKTQQMRDVYGKYIFPEYSNGGKLMNTADVGVQTVNDVLGPHMKGALADPRSIQSHLIDSGWFTNFVKDKLYLGSSKAISGLDRVSSNLSKFSNIYNKETGKIKNTGWAADGLNSWKGKLPIMQDVFNALDSWHLNPNKTELTKEYIWKQLELKNKEYEKLYQANMESWLETGSSFKKWSKENIPSWTYPDKLTRKPKLRVYNKEDVMKNLKIDNGLVSVGQEILSEDILLATIRARGVWNINDPKNGALVLGDSYQQGAGVADKVLGIGSDVNRFFYDIVPWDVQHSFKLAPQERLVSDHLYAPENLREMGLNSAQVKTLSRGSGSSTVGLSVTPKTGQYWETAKGPMEEAIGIKAGLPMDLGVQKKRGLLTIDDYWGNNLLQ